MKTHYKINKNKVIVSDDKLGKINYDYQDNLDDILIEENLIEEISKEIKISNEKLISAQTTLLTKFKKGKFLPLYVIEFIIPLIISGALLFNNSILIAMFILASSLSLMCITKVIELFDRLHLKNEINSLTLTIEELNKNLTFEKSKLKKLKRNKKNINNIEDVKVFELKNNHKLKKIRERINLYKMCGYCMEDLMKYQQSGTLRKRFEEDYTEEQLSEIEKIINEHGKKLVKKI